jgi:hypothetical protein
MIWRIEGRASSFSYYLGRNVDGQPVRMRSAPDEVKEKTKKKTMEVQSCDHCR